MYIVPLNLEKIQEESNKWENPAYAMAKIPLPQPPETTKLRKIQYHHFTKTSKNYWHNKNSAPFYKDFKKFLTQQEYTNTNWKLTNFTIKLQYGYFKPAGITQTDKHPLCDRAKCKNLAVACRRWCWCSVQTPISAYK